MFMRRRTLALRDVCVWGGGGANPCGFEMKLKLVENSAETVGVGRQKADSCRQTGCHV
jgi:hypothetical protein